MLKPGSQTGIIFFTNNHKMPSTVIAHTHYYPDKQILRVVFVSGMVYDYLDVPEAVYRSMKNAYSKGIFLNTEIKKNYRYNKVS
jgi:hypothetical protein